MAAGEAAVWPPDVLHAAWTDGTPMRAIVVELAEDPRQLASVVDGVIAEVVARPVSRGEGQLADRPRRRSASEVSEGEPD